VQGPGFIAGPLPFVAPPVAQAVADLRHGGNGPQTGQVSDSCPIYPPADDECAIPAAGDWVKTPRLASGFFWGASAVPETDEFTDKQV